MLDKLDNWLYGSDKDNLIVSTFKFALGTFVTGVVFIGTFAVIIGTIAFIISLFI